MQKRFYSNALNAYRIWRNPQRSASEIAKTDLGLDVEISVSSKKVKNVSAFQPNIYHYSTWSVKRQTIVSVEHRGYIADAETFEQATQQLISMVRPMHYDLGERMMDSVKNFGVKTK